MRLIYLFMRFHQSECRLIVWSMEYAVLKSLVLGGELADVKLYGFDYLPEVDLREELSGATTHLVDAAAANLNGTALYGIRFRLGELKRVSVAAFHDGALADVADSTLQSGMEDAALELKVYTLNGVSLGIAVDDDVDSESVWGRLADKSDAVVAIVRQYDEDRNKRIKQLHEYFSLPALVRCGSQLYAFGMEEAKLLVP